MNIQIRNLSKRFGSFHAVDDVGFDVEDGSLVALLGPSGSGKSTILRILAGLETSDSGTILFDGEPADHLDPRERAIGFVFQHYALFRHMTVADNIAFGLRARKVDKSRIEARVAEMLKLTSLEGLGKRYPAQLSGGQRQRVALARALAPEPKILLLDEPFGAVDAKVREELRQWLRRLHDEVGVTSMFVTHDQEEAFAVADKVLVIRGGKVEQMGAPVEILDRPATEFVARFVGDANVFDTTVEDGIATVGPLRVGVHDTGFRGKGRLVVRSYDMKFILENPGIATVSRIVALGDRVKVEAVLDGGFPITAHFPRRSSLVRGMEAGSRIDIEVTLGRVYPVETEGRPGAPPVVTAASVPPPAATSASLALDP
ncbi:MAG: sulfate/molybdate ABC transporter ATP-binding protein [Polyangiales bacterium]